MLNFAEFALIPAADLRELQRRAAPGRRLKPHIARPRRLSGAPTSVGRNVPGPAFSQNDPGHLTRGPGGT